MAVFKNKVSEVQFNTGGASIATLRVASPITALPANLNSKPTPLLSALSTTRKYFSPAITFLLGSNNLPSTLKVVSALSLSPVGLSALETPLKHSTALLSHAPSRRLY